MFGFVLLLFVDSCNRVWRVTEDSSAGPDTSVREAYRSDVQARKFYAQRNMYLCGFTLFLSLYPSFADMAKLKGLGANDRDD
jgi:B-cell receptor-associated protein 31